MLTDSEESRLDLAAAAPALRAAFSELADRWLDPVLGRLEAGGSHAACPGKLDDLVLGAIELMPRETIPLDSPLLHGLRGVREPGAGLRYAAGPIPAWIPRSGRSPPCTTPAFPSSRRRRPSCLAIT